MIACCGFECSACPAYEKNIKDFRDQTRASKKWLKYFDVYYPAGQMRCSGCPVKNNGNELPFKGCKIRPCVKAKHLKHCGHCGSYPCKKQKPRLENYEATAKKLRGCLPSEEYVKFIKPYDAKKRLDKINGNLKKQGSIK